MELSIVSAIFGAVLEALGMRQTGQRWETWGIVGCLTYESRFGKISNKPMIVCGLQRE